MAIEGKRWVVWFSNPEYPVWGLWSTSKTKKVVEEDAKLARKDFGYQTFIQGPISFPEFKKVKS